jgi:polyhydroxyalkanoate synthesis regulator phasin
VNESESLREFIRELLLRFDRRTEAWERDSERRHREAMARFDALQADMRELREESRAHTQALLRVLDRLDGGATA